MFEFESFEFAELSKINILSDIYLMTTLSVYGATPGTSDQLPSQ